MGGTQEDSGEVKGRAKHNSLCSDGPHFGSHIGTSGRGKWVCSSPVTHSARGLVSPALLRGWQFWPVSMFCLKMLDPPSSVLLPHITRSPSRLLFSFGNPRCHSTKWEASSEPVVPKAPLVGDHYPGERSQERRLLELHFLPLWLSISQKATD